MSRFLYLVKRGLREPKRIPAYLGCKVGEMTRRLAYYRFKLRHPDASYGQFYAEVMNRGATKDPKSAVGGEWERIGRMQLEFLVAQGLKPTHTLLDFGCGCLRAGIWLVRYLEAEKYHGCDISAGLLDVGRELIRDVGLEAKQPTLLLSSGLSFDEFSGKTFDYVLAQSVLTHMPIGDVEECFQSIRKVMHSGTKFFATFHDGGERQFTRDCQNFYYPFDTLREIGRTNGLRVELVERFVHPRNQKMLNITLEAER